MMTLLLILAAAALFTLVLGATLRSLLRDGHGHLPGIPSHRSWDGSAF
ncbi:hypothetical protein N2K95_11240 [Arthrobacter zhaoxinii]|uniref:Uncharacterized protein n=1 Tax=Arthrobacter zhaoxinii TaxID=2964616 RepID=A0ABY5YRB1_9MICC|nr:hypothetical protein [Arthrobacter zhaoxinii]UWX96240.1 hypothetical protein N2K95_11240 [Arthrobacter zhaoxinii]